MSERPKPTTITTRRERKPTYDHVGIFISVHEYPLFSPEDEEWWSSVYPRDSFTFKKLRDGENLVYRLAEAIKKREREGALVIVEEIEARCMKNFDEKPSAERWAHMALQLPGDWGPIGEKRERLKGIITPLAKGRVLEAMCGFSSYFGDSASVDEVIALDYCREALELYQYPERTRILFDLEQVVQDEMLPFDENSFQTVGVFFGEGYLSNRVAVYREFHRILSPGGILLVAGGTTHGYENMLRAWFYPARVSREMGTAGFTTRINHLRALKTKFEAGDYYLIQGVKE